MTNKLGVFLKEKRIEKQLSLKDVELKTGITASYLSRIEQGSRGNISLVIIKKLSDFFGIQEKTIIELGTNNLYSEQDNNLDIIEDAEVRVLLNCILKRIATILVDK
ncbi:helix-turn-helix domain-containing protein [Clostridium sp.]